MQQPEQSNEAVVGAILQRVLIVDPDPRRTQCLTQLVTELKITQLASCSNPAEALEAARGFDPQLILASYEQEGSDGLAFARALRRGASPCSRAPLILLLDRPNPAILDEARDSGVHEFLVRPFVFHDLSRRIKAVTLRSRDWVDSSAYVGPDRRQFNTSERGWQTR